MRGSITHLVAEDARLGEPLEQIALLSDHVRQLVHLVLERRDLLRRRDELTVVLVHVLLQLGVGVLGERLDGANRVVIDHFNFGEDREEKTLRSLPGCSSSGDAARVPRRTSWRSP